MKEIGQKFGLLTVIDVASPTRHGNRRVLVMCECGVQKPVAASLLAKTGSCGCSRRRQKRTPSLQGRRFGRLTVSGDVDGNRKRKCTVECVCGVIKDVAVASLLRGATRSCGCLLRERAIAANARHRMSKTPEYIAWIALVQRCTNPRHPNYERYGGRGITVCDRWRGSFENFFADVGPRPGSGYSIDRLDNSRGYEPGNCAWRTIREQARNTRISRLTPPLVAELRAAVAAGWGIRALGRVHGISHGTVRRALEPDWDVGA